MSGQGQSFAPGRDAHWYWVRCFIVLGGGAFPGPSVTELTWLHHTVTKEQKDLGPPLQTPCSGSPITQPWAASTTSSEVYSYPDFRPSCFVLCLEHSFFSRSNSLSFLGSQLEGPWLWQAPCHPDRWEAAATCSFTALRFPKLYFIYASACLFAYFPYLLTPWKAGPTPILLTPLIPAPVTVPDTRRSLIHIYWMHDFGL